MSSGIPLGFILIVFIAIVLITLVIRFFTRDRKKDTRDGAADIPGAGEPPAAPAETESEEKRDSQICPSCNRSNPPDHNFCEGCGQKLR